jgi:hypothetical protein
LETQKSPKAGRINFLKNYFMKEKTIALGLNFILKEGRERKKEGRREGGKEKERKEGRKERRKEGGEGKMGHPFNLK